MHTIARVLSVDSHAWHFGFQKKKKTRVNNYNDVVGDEVDIFPVLIFS